MFSAKFETLVVCRLKLQHVDQATAGRIGHDFAQCSNRKLMGLPAAEKHHFCVTGFYGFFMLFYGVFTGFLRVGENQVFLEIRCLYVFLRDAYGFFTGFYGVCTGCSKKPTFCLANSGRFPICS